MNHSASPIPFIVRPLVFAACLVVQTAVGENLLRNGAFAEPVSDANPLPLNWHVAPQDSAEVSLARGGSDGPVLTAAIASTSSSQGQVSQRVATRPNRRLLVTADVRSSVAGAAFVQVKRYAGRRELERIALPASGTEWRTVELEIDSREADAVEVICRWKRDEKYQGGTAAFRNIRMEDLGEKVRIPLAVERVDGVATLQSIGVTATMRGDWEPGVAGRLQYRLVGEAAWREAMPPVARPSEGEFRGSVLDLRPGTEYEVAFTLLPDGKPVSTRVSTWREDVPVGRVVELPDQFDRLEPYVVALQGTVDAWVHVRPAPGARGAIVAASGGPDFAVRFDGASFVLFEGFEIRGGEDDAVRINNSHDVIIRGCDIAGWGQVGAPDARGIATNALGKAINMQSGIAVHNGAERIRVERNFIHSPRGSANSWRHGHPHGATGISLSNPLGNIVVRDNDIIGSERHWWNDGIEGEYNSYVTGGPHRDSDIVGNTVAFANDDGIELDGGQRNVRCVGNLFRWTYCGVSCAPNLRGPSYVYRNVIVLGDERGRANFGFKMGGAQFANQGFSSLFRNTVVSHGNTFRGGLYGVGPNPIRSADNLYHLGAVAYQHRTGAVFAGDLVPPGGFPPHLLEPGGDTPASTPVEGVASFVDEAHGDYRIASAPVRHEIGAFDRAASSASFPVRGGEVSAHPALLPMGTASVGRVELALSPEAGTTWKAVSNSPWLSCSPTSGGIAASGGRIAIELKVDAAKAGDGFHRGAMTFRTDRGHLRTVFVTATILPERPWSLRVEAEALESRGFALRQSADASGGAYLVATNGTPHRGAWARLDIDVPEDGEYAIWARTLTEGPLCETSDSFFIRVDGGEPRRWDLICQSPAFWMWSPAGVWDGPDMNRLSLAKGGHRLEILSREAGARLDALYVGNCPALDDVPQAGIETGAANGLSKSKRETMNHSLHDGTGRRQPQ